MVAAARFSVAELTRRQLEVLQAIRQHLHDQGRPPTVRELARVLGIKTANGVAGHLKALEKKGRISRGSGRVRAITVTGYSGGLTLPFLGLVAAGPAIEAEELTDRLDLRELFGAEGLFAYRAPAAVAGHQIERGDLLILRHPGRGDSFRTVAAQAGGALGLWHYLPRKGGAVRLAPVEGAGEGVEVGPGVCVLGVLEGVIRKG